MLNPPPTRVVLLLVFVCLGLLPCGKPALKASKATELDIMVVYTSAVLSAYVDEAGVIAHAASSVESMNTVLQNSEIPLLFNLVAVEWVDYVESNTDMADDLAFITGEDEGFIDEDLLAQVRGLRDAYGADLVTLFRNGPVSGVAGIAWIPDPNNPNPKFGYSVVSAESALVNLVLAHELGHNLSSGHGHGESGAAPIVDFARGHRFTANATNYRTVMAIDTSYQRIPHFSNPLVFFEGEPTGVPMGQVNEADNASAFSLSGPGIAEFRLTQTESPIFLYQPVGATIVSGQVALLDAFVQGFPPLDIQWYAGMVGDTSTPLASDDQAQERGGIVSVLETSALSEPAFYWIDLTNPNATTQSDPVQVVVIPPLSDPQLSLVEQDTFNTGVASTAATLYQDVFLANHYVESIEVGLAKQGNPPPAVLQFASSDGVVLAQLTVAADGMAEWNNSTIVSMPVNRFTEPGETYRISLIPSGGDDSNRFFWTAGSDAQDAEAGIGDNNIAGEGIAFVFAVKGQTAWTYHTWLGAEGIPATTGRPTDAVGEDGFANLVRYALGFGANDPRSLIAPLLGEIMAVNGEDVIPFSFGVRRDAVDVAIVIETSNDLVDWTDLAPSQVHFVETIDDTRDVYQARVPVAGMPRQFVRIRVDNPPN